MRTRKQQINTDLLGDIARHFGRSMGVPMPRRFRACLRAALRDAAMIGAAEERGRTLEILRARLGVASLGVAQNICERSVLDVLGYVPAKGRKVKHA